MIRHPTRNVRFKIFDVRSESEHESSRRMKTEFLVQLDGAGTLGEEKILIVGATNRPQVRPWGIIAKW